MSSDGTAPVIGITGRRSQASDIRSLPSVVEHEWIDWYFSAYSRAILMAGGIPVHLASAATAALAAPLLDGVLLAGGTDIHPENYGVETDPSLGPVDAYRDRWELELLAVAVERKLPLLGVCRGCQIINVAFNGTLFQDVPAGRNQHERFDLLPSSAAHTVTIANESRLHELYGPVAEVNSLHHQSIDHVGDYLRVAAMASDGTIEGIEHEILEIVGVQWHPELMSQSAAEPVLNWLVESARRRGTSC